jgi:hypothetical protein
MEYINLGKSNYDWTKAFIAGVGNGHGPDKAETDIDRIIQLESGQASGLCRRAPYVCGISNNLSRSLRPGR